MERRKKIMKKICIVVNSRANYARIKSLIHQIKKNKRFDLQIVLGSSAILDIYGDVRPLLKKDKIRITKQVYTIIQGGNLETMAKSTGLLLIELSSIFAEIKPDYVITVADRHETLATAIAASYMNIPLIHTQGGELTGNIDESVRHAITKLAHIHFPATKLAKKNIIQMGENPKNIFLTGCPSIDLAKEYKNNKKKFFPKNFENLGLGNKIDLKKKYLVVMYHPVTNEYMSNKETINKLLSSIKKISLPTIWMWPNVDAGTDIISKEIRKFREKNKKLDIKFYKNFSPEEFLFIIDHCSCFVGNSSSAIREGSFLGTPCVNIGTRQFQRERGGNVFDVKNQQPSIEAGILSQISKKKYRSKKTYGDGNAAKKMISVIKKLGKIKIEKKFIRK